MHDVRERLVDYNVKPNKFSCKLHSLLQTVSNMKDNFSAEEIRLANKTKNLCKILGAHLSENSQDG